jgi:hypothetical protein
MNTSSAKKVRKSKERHHGYEQEKSVPEAPYAQPEQNAEGGCWPSAFERTSFEQEYQRAVD